MELDDHQIDLIERWFDARGAGIPAGSSCRVMVDLRRQLFAAGLWWVPYPRAFAARKLPKNNNKK